MQNITGYRILQLSQTLTTSSGSAYSANDQVGGLQTINLQSNFPAAFSTVNFVSVRIFSVHIIDTSKQSAAMNIYFFSSAPTLASSDNDPLNISAADMAAKCQGFDTLASYVTSANATVGTTATSAVGHYLVPASNNLLYAVLQTTGTPTYTSTSAVTLVYHLECHY